MSGSHLVIGTAGHIDHGKTTLIRALTGVNLDSLPEERSRGITIALGFTHMALPSGRTAAFVDVPGHERLVRTMIAGATGLDAVMLCVAATEGVMPQTREHLAILQILGIERGLVVLTMCDLADEDTLDLARLDVEDAISGTFLDGAPILESSAGDDPQGIEPVRAAIDDLPTADRATDGVFRLPVDRAFIQHGFGTVVTGTARAGTLKDGSDVEILPIGLKARVRGLQVHGNPVSVTQAGWRTAINLAGIERDDLNRGMVIVSQSGVEPAQILDTQVGMLADAPRLESGSRVRLLVGTAEVMATAEVIGEPALEPGATQWVQLRTQAPLVAFPGDAFVLRRESPVETLGGGTILDPWAPRVRRKQHDAARGELEALAGGDRNVFLSRAGPRGLRTAEAQLRGVDGGTILAGWVFHPDQIAAHGAAITKALAAWHEAHPLAPGAPRRALHAKSLKALTDRSFDALIEHLVTEGLVALEGPRLRLSSFEITLTAAVESQRAELLGRLLAAGLEGLTYSNCVASSPDLLHLLLAENRVARVGAQVLHADPVRTLTADVRKYLAENGEMAPSAFKEITGLSRKHAIPMLEWLDATGVTTRQGSVRVATNG